MEIKVKELLNKPVFFGNMSLKQACNQNSAARGAMIFLGGAITYNKFSYGQLKYKL